MRNANYIKEHRELINRTIDACEIYEKGSIERFFKSLSDDEVKHLGNALIGLSEAFQLLIMISTVEILMRQPNVVDKTIEALKEKKEGVS